MLSDIFKMERKYTVSALEFSDSYGNTEEDHYDELEDSPNLLDDGIEINYDLLDEYDEHYDDEMERDTEVLFNNSVIPTKDDDYDELENDHYDSLEE